jgi:GTPase
MSSIVAIVGRPNVGKSTLFNRLSRSRDSLVDNQPGVTRDRLYSHIRWGESSLILIDTGGFSDQDSELFSDLVREQIVKAIDEADCVLFMVDSQKGLLAGDEEIADILRRAGKRVYMAVNKIDGVEQEERMHDFYRLGFDNVYPVSAEHGYGIRSLMEDLISGLPEEIHLEAESGDQIRVAVVGRPNAGKSSLINRILGIDRLLVSELPGTTRDSVDTLFKWKGKDYLLIDTAGIRRKGRVKEKVDKFSMIKALKSLDRCHVAIILLDATAGIVEQDARICGYALDRGRGVVLAVNKWDLIKKDHDKRKQIKMSIDRQLQFLKFAPIINLSALTGERVKKLFDKIDLVFENFNMRVGTGELNRALEDMVHKKPPPRTGRVQLKFYYATQTGIKPPTFIVFVNKPELIHFSYERYIINQIRERFEFDFTPIRLVFRKRKGG